MMEVFYFWLVNRLARHPGSKWTPLTLWIWRRTAAWMQASKHLARRNWSQAFQYLRLL